MKKIFAILAITASLIVSAVAQQTQAGDFYLMRNSGDAAIVLKAINMELKLSEDAYKQVKDLLDRSAASQQEILKKHDDPETLNATKARQTAHIEGNLESILGVQFAEYQLKKAAIVAHWAGVKKNP